MVAEITPFLQRIENLEKKTIRHSKEQDQRRKIRTALHEESERIIDVIRDADRMSDVEVAKQFSKYGEVEYIHRRHLHYTICYETKKSANLALKEYQEAGLSVKKPEPQIWVSHKNEGPYKKCTICQKTVSSQKLNWESHERLCQEKNTGARRKEKKVVSFQEPLRGKEKITQGDEIGSTTKRNVSGAAAAAKTTFNR